MSRRTNYNTKRSQIVIVGVLLIIIGVALLSYNYFMDLKGQVTSDIAISLMDKEIKRVEKEEEEEPQERVIEDNPKAATISYDYIGYLNIPSVNIKRGFVTKESKYNDINYNITVADAADYPDVEQGNFIVYAHSGSAYIAFFENLYLMNIGDYAYVTYNGVERRYQLKKRENQEKTGVIVIHRDNYDVRVMTLITCTKNSDHEQTVYMFEEA